MKLIQTGEQVTGTVLSNTGERAISASSRALLESSNQIANAAERIGNKEFEDDFNIAAKEAEEQAGIDAVEAVESGYTFDEDNNNTIYAQQFNKTARMTAQANIDAQITSKSKELSVAYSNDAQGFQTALKEHVDAFSYDNNLDAQQKAVLSGKVVAENKKYLGSIMAKSVIEQKNKESVSVINAIETRSNVALQNLFDGDKVAFNEDLGLVNKELELAVENNNITPAQAAQQTIAFTKKANITEVEGKVERAVNLMLSDDSFTYEEQVGYLNQGNKKIDEWLVETEKSGLYSPSELNQEEDKLRKSLQRANDTLFKKQSDLINGNLSSSIVMNSDVLDYKNKDEKKAIDIVYKSMAGEAGQDIFNPQTRLLAIELSASKKIIPSEVLSSMRKNSKSRDPERVLAAVNLVTAMVDKSPDLIDQFTDSEIAMAAKVQSLIGLGVNPQDSVVEANEYFRKPAQERKESAISNATSEGTAKAYNKAVRSSLEDFKDDNLDPMFFSSVDDSSMLSGDYKRLHDHYLTLTGDYEAATELTNKQVKNVYGVSYLNGDPKIQKYSPELVMNKSNDKSEWLLQSWGKQVNRTVNELNGKGVKVRNGDIIYQPSVETYRGVKAWKMFYKDSDGILIPVSETKAGYWFPNKGETEVGKNEAYEIEQAKIKAAQKAQEAKILYTGNTENLKSIRKRLNNDDGLSLSESVQDIERDDKYQ